MKTKLLRLMKTPIPMKQGMVTITNNLLVLNKGANMVNALTKLGSAVGSVGGMAADAIDGVVELGTSAKSAVKGEINTLQYERDIENAVSRIASKAEAIKQIKAVLGCSFIEAEELLNQEMQIGK